MLLDPLSKSSVILHTLDGECSVYACTLPSAKKILQEVLSHDAKSLVKLVNRLKYETRPIRPASWLQLALAEVRDFSPAPLHLNILLNGPNAEAVEAANKVKPITLEMQDELVVLFFRLGLSLDSLTDGTVYSDDVLDKLFSSLRFLAPGRKLVGQYGACFVEDGYYEGYKDLMILLKDSWKKSATDYQIITNYYCPFFTDWAGGNWQVKKILSDSDAPVMVAEIAAAT